MADSPARPAGASRIWVGGLSVAAMLALVALMARVRGPAVSQAQLDPAVWWYVARASGLLAWVLLGASVVGGLLMATQLAHRGTRTWTEGLHEFVGALAVVFTVLHLASALVADQLRIGLRELLVPFVRPDNPVAQGCGVLAFYLLTAVVLTSWARALLSWRWWRRVHLLTFPLWGLACAHAVLTGSDTSHPIFYWVGLAVGVVILFLGVFRLLTVRLAGAAAAAPAGLGQAGTRPSLVLERQPADPAAVAAGMRLLIGQTTWEADNVLSLRLASPDGAPLPSWEPGAHIELALPSGRGRQYSLCSDPDDTRSYRIAVLQVPAGRGGSVEVHTGARVGQLLTVHGPRNHFPLVPSP
ncbi:MAG TPA: ferredoxin reductase family protein, partial [Pseudonocardiaceae bacterium]|nr:ferredoxin reductase family protein [Pseudonocardiaceae bacterium]